MRSSGAAAAISRNGTAMMAFGRAMPGWLVTLIVTPAAPAALAASNAPAAAPAIVLLMAPLVEGRSLRNREVGVDHCPERPLRIAGGIEQQRAVGAGHGETVQPGVVVGDAPGGDRGPAGAIEALNNARYSTAWSCSAWFGGLAP